MEPTDCVFSLLGTCIYHKHFFKLFLRENTISVNNFPDSEKLGSEEREPTDQVSEDNSQRHLHCLLFSTTDYGSAAGSWS